ncbi:DUF4845 domain-containing protein [Macromonas bipunctata]|uniref:DUF4845 domain-containing protein n=1 Tax=Macromonas bipunctata TaxID=183670 RepID=UPI000C34BD82|nr:DUF4845 domain-containing protein [Macromonas bipunctata]
MRHRQRGVSVPGMLAVGAVVALLVVLLARLVPTLIEYQAVQKAVNRAATGTTVAEIRALFNKAASIDDISALSGNDLQISKDNNQVVVAFEYEREIHLFGPAYLVMRYAGRSD